MFYKAITNGRNLTDITCICDIWDGETKSAHTDYMVLLLQFQTFWLSALSSSYKPTDWLNRRQSSYQSIISFTIDHIINVIKYAHNTEKEEGFDNIEVQI